MTIDDTADTVRTFLDKIAVAKGNQDEWVETSPEVIAHYNRRGMNGAKFFIFEGIKVCEHGKVDEIEHEMNESIAKKTFGDREGTIENR